jgi:hypothetical protein
MEHLLQALHGVDAPASVVKNFRTADSKKFIFGERLGDPAPMRGTPIRTEILKGVDLITDF